MRNPWLAAVLNFVLSGLGYLYLGKRKVLGILLLVGEVLTALWIYSEPIAMEATKNIWFFLAGTVRSSAFAIDAHNEARITQG